MPFSLNYSCRRSKLTTGTHLACWAGRLGQLGQGRLLPVIATKAAKVRSCPGIPGPEADTQLHRFSCDSKSEEPEPRQLPMIRESTLWHQFYICLESRINRILSDRKEVSFYLFFYHFPNWYIKHIGSLIPPWKGVSEYLSCKIPLNVTILYDNCCWLLQSKLNKLLFNKI